MKKKQIIHLCFTTQHYSLLIKLEIKFSKNQNT